MAQNEQVDSDLLVLRKLFLLLNCDIHLLADSAACKFHFSELSRVANLLNELRVLIQAKYFFKHDWLAVSLGLIHRDYLMLTEMEQV